MGETVYSMDVPGDDPETLAIIEGGVAGDTIVFQIAGQPALQTALWQSGSYIELDLTTATLNNPPVITEGESIAVGMSEDGLPTPFALTLHATDTDTTDTLSWSIASGASHGTAAASGTGLSQIIDYTPISNFNDSDSFVVQVSDGHGGTDTITVDVTITPVNDAPIANDDSYTAVENTLLTVPHIYGLLANDADPENDTLTAIKVSDPSNGVLELSADGSFTYDPAINFLGADSFTYTAFDGSTNSPPATVSILVTIPLPPFPSSFYGEIHISDNPPAVGNTVEAYVPGITGPAATAAISTNAADLVYHLDVLGDLEGTSDKEGGVEGDTITFKINGRVVATSVWHGGTNTPLNFHPPQGIPGGPYSGDEGVPINFNGSAIDWGTDAAVYQWDWDNDGAYDEMGQNPGHTWTVNGTYTVGLKVTDSQGGEGTATVQVMMNNPPTDINLSDSSIDENLAINTVVGALSTTDPDIGDTFTYELVSGAGDSDNASFNILGSDLRSSVIFDFETRSSYSIRVRTTDQGSLSFEKVFAITIANANDAPVLDAIGNKTVDELVELSFTATAADADLPAGIAANFDGMNDLVTIPNNAQINNGSAYAAKTVELWFRANQLTGQQVLYEQGGVTNGLNIFLDGANLYVGAWTGGIGNWVSTPVQTATTYHVALVYNGTATTLTGYLNGAPFQSATTSFATITPHIGLIGIGGINDQTLYQSGPRDVSNGDNFEGAIDEVALYNQVLAPARILSHAQCGVTPGCNYPFDILSDSPIAFWRFDETSSATAVNIGTIGNAVNGAYTNGVLVNQPGLIFADPPDKAAGFDGQNARVNVPSDSQINSGGPYAAKTVELWFNANSVTGRQLLYEQGGDLNGLNLFLEGGNLYAGAYATPAGITYSTWVNTSVSAGVTYHVSLVYSGSGGTGTVTGYLNGESFQSLPTEFGNIPSAIRENGIGGISNFTRFPDGPAQIQNGYNFNGVIDEVALYNQVITPARIQSHALCGATFGCKYQDTVLSDNPIAYWRLGEPSGTTAVNIGSIGNAVNGVYQNGVLLSQPGLIAAGGSTTLIFSLVGAPAGAAIDGATGVFSWTPTEAQGVGSYQFTVRVCDNGDPALCDEEEITVTVNEVAVTHSFSLAPGWNLVSFDLHPMNTGIVSVLSSIAGNYDLVYGWDAAGGHPSSGNWMKYDPTAPFGNSLSSLDETMGFWIRMTVADTLDVVGAEVPVTTDIALFDNVGGWNLVAYPAAGNGALPDVLRDHGVGTDFTLVYGYHADDLADQWKKYDPGQLFGNDLTAMTPGWGYWVKVSADNIWVVNYPAP